MPPDDRLALLSSGMRAGVVSRGAMMAATLATFTLIARSVDAAAFGALALAVAIAGVAGMIGSLQTRTLLSRAPGVGLARRVVPVVTASAAVAAAVTVGLATVVPLVDAVLGSLLLRLVPLVLVEPVLQIAQGDLASRGDARRLGVTEAVAPVARLSMTLVVAFAGGDVFAFATGISVGSVVATGVVLALASPLQTADHLPFSVGAQLRASLGLIVVSLNWVLISRTDVVVLGLVSSEAELGAYAAAQRLLDMLLSMQGALMLTVLPSAAASTRRELGEIFHVARSIPIGLLMPGAMFMAVWGDQVVRLIFGEDLVGPFAVYVAFGAAAAIHVATGPVGALRIAAGQERQTALVALWAIVINLAASALLGLWCGATGVAVATLVTMAWMNTVNLLGLRRLLDRGHRRNVPALVSTAVVLAATGALRLITPSLIGLFAAAIVCTGFGLASLLRRVQTS